MTDGQTIGAVSKWLDDVTPLTADPNYKSDFVDDYKHPQQLYARFEQLAAANPEIAEIVAMPNKTNGYQRKAQAIDRLHDGHGRAVRGGRQLRRVGA